MKLCIFINLKPCHDFEEVERCLICTHTPPTPSPAPPQRVVKINAECRCQICVWIFVCNHMRNAICHWTSHPRNQQKCPEGGALHSLQPKTARLQKHTNVCVCECVCVFLFLRPREDFTPLACTRIGGDSLHRGDLKCGPHRQITFRGFKTLVCTLSFVCNFVC